MQKNPVKASKNRNSSNPLQNRVPVKNSSEKHRKKRNPQESCFFLFLSPPKRFLSNRNYQPSGHLRPRCNYFHLLQSSFTYGSLLLIRNRLFFCPLAIIRHCLPSPSSLVSWLLWATSTSSGPLSFPPRHFFFWLIVIIVFSLFFCERKMQDAKTWQAWRNIVWCDVIQREVYEPALTFACALVSADCSLHIDWFVVVAALLSFAVPTAIIYLMPLPMPYAARHCQQRGQAASTLMCANTWTIHWGAEASCWSSFCDLCPCIMSGQKIHTHML